MQEGDLGTVSMGILYTSFTLFCVAASPVVTRMGPKRALVVGSSGYLLFILANLVPTWCVRLGGGSRPLLMPWCCVCLELDACCLIDKMRS